MLCSSSFPPSPTGSSSSSSSSHPPAGIWCSSAFSPLSRQRHCSSEPNLLARRTPLAEFMEWWNRRQPVPSFSATRRCRVVPFPLLPSSWSRRRGGCRTLFRRGTSDPQQPQQLDNNSGQHPQQRSSMPSSPLPKHQKPSSFPPSSSSSSPPFTSSSSSLCRRPIAASRMPINSWRDSVCPDGDLLPASWFMLDAQDLTRLHQKLQRRISRRRSLTRANMPFGELNSGRSDIVLQKYQRLRRGGVLLRRALSDHQICFMDPKRDVEAAEIRKTKDAAGTWQLGAGAKRVSFSAPTTTIVPEEDEEAEEAEVPEGNGKDRARSRTPIGRYRDRSATLSPRPSPRPRNVPAPLAMPVKPILLARKGSIHSAASSSSPSGSSATDSSSASSFRRRINTITSVEDSEYGLCPMDYATFRAWRRGSRLSVDVLNNAAAAQNSGAGSGPDGRKELEPGRDGRRRMKGGREGGGGAGGGMKTSLGGWMMMLKRVLAECMQQEGRRRDEEERRRDESQGRAGGRGGGERALC